MGQLKLFLSPPQIRKVVIMIIFIFLSFSFHSRVWWKFLLTLPLTGEMADFPLLSDHMVVSARDWRLVCRPE